MTEHFEKIPTSITDETQCTVVNVQPEIAAKSLKPISRFRRYKKNKLIILSLVGILVVVCCIFAVFYFNGSTQAVNGTVSYNICNDLHCCQNKDVNVGNKKSNIDCNVLNIQDCALNDNICVWECGHHTIARSLNNYKFVRFDDGTGVIHNFRLNRSNINISWPDYNKSESIEDILNKSSFYQESRCGDVYRVELDPGIAELRLNDPTPAKTSSPQQQVSSELNNINRRLAVIGTDDRGQITSPSDASNRIAQIVGATIGQCTGTLISPNHILTAAHCVYDTDNNQFIHPEHIYLGRVSSTTGTDYAWATLTVPQRWVDLASTPNGYSTDAAMEAAVSTDYAVITLQTADTGRGYYQVGYDNTIPVNPNPSPLFIMRQHPNVADQMWYSLCHIIEAGTEFFKTDCDTNGGSSGAAFVRWDDYIVYGTHMGGPGASPAFNYEHRIDQTTYNTLCDITNIC